MSDDEYRALIQEGPAVVMVAKADMLRLLDDAHKYRHEKAKLERFAKLTRKLTDEQVQEIRCSSLKGTELAMRYGVTNTTIYKIKNGVSYRHVKARANE